MGTTERATNKILRARLGPRRRVCQLRRPPLRPGAADGASALPVPTGGADGSLSSARKVAPTGHPASFRIACLARFLGRYRRGRVGLPAGGSVGLRRQTVCRGGIPALAGPQVRFPHPDSPRRPSDELISGAARPASTDRPAVDVASGSPRLSGGGRASGCSRLRVAPCPAPLQNLCSACQRHVTALVRATVTAP
jgi:hypothetical protein